VSESAVAERGPGRDDLCRGRRRSPCRAFDVRPGRASLNWCGMPRTPTPRRSFRARP